MKKGLKLASLLMVALFLLVLAACGNDDNGEVSTDENGGVSTYEGVGEGFNGDITALVTLEDGVITDIQVDTDGESDGFRERPSEEIPAQIIANQSIEVDAISGATATSEGIIEAVTAALVAAGVNLDDF